jgi:glycosyltransferase involved in cell wall biosynthesis
MRISIITLAIDSSEYLDEAIDSAEREGPFDLEHIIVHDGDDAFADALRQKYPAIKVLRGRGEGATVAAALGVAAATGDFILLLHSDDRLCPGALARLTTEATARPEVMIWTGGARIFCTFPDGREATVRRMLDRDATILSLENVCDVVPLLSARFCNRAVFSQIGNFDANFSECSDREFLLRAVIAGVSEASLDIMVSEIRMHEGSRTMHHRSSWVPPYLVEHTRMAEMWCARPGVDRGTRRFLRNWRARELLRLFVHQCRAGQWKAAAAGFLAEALKDPLWMLRIVTVLGVQERRRRGQDDPGDPRRVASRAERSEKLAPSRRRSTD